MVICGHFRLFNFIDTLVGDISDDSAAAGGETNRSFPYIINSTKILIRQSSKPILKASLQAHY